MKFIPLPDNDKETINKLIEEIVQKLERAETKIDEMKIQVDNVVKEVIK